MNRRPSGAPLAGPIPFTMASESIVELSIPTEAGDEIVMQYATADLACN